MTLSNDPFAEYEKKTRTSRKLSRGMFFFVNYLCITSIIFVGLLAMTNYGAYSELLHNYFFPDDLNQRQMLMSNSLASTSIDTQEVEDSFQEVDETTSYQTDKMANFLQKHLARQQVAVTYEQYSPKNLLKQTESIHINTSINPYDNRVVIPKIGKNIPLVNVENREASSSNEWHKIFLEELENGVIKYPGSANPGEIGNSFIFGHSSNFPWAKGVYNEVFALLDELELEDEMVIYFEQKKYVYRVIKKQIVRPGYVNAIDGSENSKLLTLMTCWPVGTTLNRLLIIGELEEI